MRSFIAGLFLFASLIGSPAAAQGQPAGPIDPARMAAAARLLEALHYDNLMDRTVEALIADAQKVFPQQLEAATKQPLPEELRNKLAAVITSSLRRSMADNRTEMRKGAMLIYASRFTAPELDRLAELQKDPVMVKMQAELPQIAAEGAALGRAAVEREMPRLKKEIEALVTDYARGKS